VKPLTPFYRFVLNALDETILQILLAAAAVSLIVGMIDDPAQGWMDGVAILCAVFIVVMVSSVNDFMKQKQFAKLNVEAGDLQVIIVKNGNEHEVSVYSVLVGDLLHISNGMVIPVDGIILRSNALVVDESAITGENEPIRKTLSRNLDTPPTPFLVSGSKVSEGTGLLMVCAVGRNSVNGKLKALLQEDSEDETPLQKKLEETTNLIGKIGFGISGLTFAALAVGIGFHVYSEGAWTSEDTSKLIASFILAIIIIVIAVPEGLPLAVTLSLAYSMGRMKKEHNFVKHLHACETMGAAHYICSDKTGTLTTNRMAVSKYLWLAQTSNVPPSQRPFIAENIARNTTAFTSTTGVPMGNPTECALLGVLHDWAIDYKDHRNPVLQVMQIPFNYRTKRMCTVYQEDCFKVYVKGAAEVVLDLCKFEYDFQGNVCLLTPERRSELHRLIEKYAENLLRSIAFAYKEVEFAHINIDNYEHIVRPKLEENLIFVGLTGIEDPIRPEVPSAVQRVHRAGLKVIMVTGDNKDTAMRIASQCHLLDDKSNISKAVLLGSEFSKAVGGLVHDKDGNAEVGNKAAFEAIIPYLRVLARSEPEDKYLLVTALKNMNFVVAVTGDGANDAPALKKSDVGFAMNICGTALAKEAADIILLDDNFTSIVNAVKWGRNIYESIRKFLQFQLTVNIVALLLTLVSTIGVQTAPLSAVQMLWVNLIMDTFAALALATEPPDEKLLLSKPFGQDEKIITPCMWKNILGQTLFQSVLLGVILFYGPSILGTDNGLTKPLGAPSQHFTFFFNLFVFLQIFNEFNCRKIKDDEKNVFIGIFENSLFVFIMLATIVVQILLVQLGG
jgi:calcium-translocating P-type ATPase